MKRSPFIVGGANSRFGVSVGKDPETGNRIDLLPLEEMICGVASEALASAEFPADAVDAVYMGACSPGAFANQELLCPVALETSVDALLYKPTFQSTAACASSSAALYQAADALDSGRIKAALVIGFEKMNLRPTPMVTDILSRCSWWPSEGAQGITFPGLFAQLATNYRDQHRIDPEVFRRMLATVAANNYGNGIQNPLAHFGPGSLPDTTALTKADRILSLPPEGRGGNPLISDPLRLHDCSPISDGASALLLVSADHPLAKSDQAVEIAGRALCTDRIAITSREQQHRLNGAFVATAQALAEAKQRAEQLQLVEVHDCFTNNQLLCLEAWGLSQEGRAGYDYLEGVYDENASCEVNLSGGLKSKGHPVGATGVSMHFFAWRQLIGSAVGSRARQTPSLAGVLNIGGSGVINCATVLRR